MGILDRVKSAFLNDDIKTANSKDMNLDQLINYLNLGGVKDDALSEATYFACMKVLSESIGKLPLKLQQYTDKSGVEQSRSHPIYNMIANRPNPYMTAAIFWSTIEFNRNHWGNAFAYIKGAGKNMTLWILPSDKVTIVYDDAMKISDSQKVWYVYNQNGKQYILDSEEVLHFKTSNTLDGITGISVQAQLAMTIQGNVKAQELVI